MSPSKPRYRFAGFVLSPSRRVLLLEGTEVPLIPRYFDLLVLLVERREEAISRREILDGVWNDVVVTDNALNQAVRILRRALGDASRSPVFIRTVSRHGYRFVHPGVREEPDDTPLPGPAGPESAPNRARPVTDPPSRAGEPDDPFEPSVAELLRPGPHSMKDDDGRREAAERLHVLGTSEILRRLDRRPGHASARAFLRDTRWDVPGAGQVPILGQPSPVRTATALIVLRLRRVLRLAGRRWVAAASGGAAAGAIAGVLGGIVLRFGPGSTATHAVFVALPLVGVIAGGLGAAGVGAGLAVAEAVIRSFRGVALVLMGAVGGGVTGSLVNLVGRLVLESLFGRDPSPLAGGFEGAVIGAAAGLGYALATPTREGGMATPRGGARLRTAVVTGACCATATAVLGWSGSHLGAMSLDFVARSFPDSQVALDPLARMVGEASPGRLTRTVISAWEGLLFGIGLALGLTRRPR